MHWFKGRRSFAVAVSFVFTFVLLISLCLLLSYNNETRTSSYDEGDDLSALFCSSYDPADPFYVPPMAVENRHEIRVAYNNDRPESISYVYTGKYNSTEDADSGDTNFHIEYDMYVGLVKSDKSKITTSFSDVGLESRESLFARVIDLDERIARLFFLNPEELNILRQGESEQLKNAYENKGFICHIIE